MPPARQLPYWILGLILLSAVTVLVLGVHFSREERTVFLEQDRAPLSSFSSRFLKEVESLQVLYEDKLIDARKQIDSEANDSDIVSACRGIVGLEQVSIFRSEERPRHFDLRETGRFFPLPPPHLLGEMPAESRQAVDIESFERKAFPDPQLWIHEAGDPPHFMTKLDYRTYLVFRLDEQAIRAAAESWMNTWIPENFSTVAAAAIPAAVKGPSGELMGTSGEIDGAARPDYLFPVPSVFGEWMISSWTKKETIIAHQIPIMVGSAILAAILVLAGLFGFTQQRRALRLAEQRVSFVNRVSHELRTPMMNILLNVDLLSDPDYGSSAKRSKRLGLIREEAGRLSRLLENVLSFSKREKGRSQEKSGAEQELRMEPTELEPLLESLLSQFAPTLARQSLEVVRNFSTAPNFILVDPDAFVQIAGNLISNVEKYASGGGKFSIATEVDSGGNQVLVTVEDFGDGIPKAEAERIFRPFTRINHGTTEGVSGTGLGLAIARDLAESMGGTLELDRNSTSQQKGARFVLTFPTVAGNIVRMAG